MDDSVNLALVSMSDDGVFFMSEKAARIFSEKYDKELVQIGGWLAKNRDTTGLGAVCDASARLFSYCRVLWVTAGMMVRCAAT